MRSETSKEQQREYDRKQTRFIGLKLNKNTDAELICWLEGRDNMQGYIKELIRKDMEARTVDRQQAGVV